ncbi:MAG: GGDEF domain-containing protein [Treponema sp.]|nr:GGDEF domain-containing protein [Candidatus Treponema caballi]
MANRFRLGLLIHDYGNEFSQELEAGIMAFCQHVNCTLYVFPIGERHSPYAIYDYQKRAGAALVNANSVDGILIATGTQGNFITKDELVAFIKSYYPIPTISIGDVIPGIPSVVPDTGNGMYDMVQHLIQKHKCKHFALISVEGQSAVAQIRTEAFMKALKDNNLTIEDKDILHGHFTYSSAMLELEKYEKQYGVPEFDAIVALNDEMAFGCIDFLTQRHISVPDQVIVAGYDDTERASHTTPSLSTVSQSIYLQGYAAAESVYSILAGGSVPDVMPVPTNAVCRQSCGCVPPLETSFATLSVSGEPVERNRLRRINSISEWAEKKNQIISIVSYQNDTQLEMTLDDLRKRMNRDIRGFEISGAAIVLYKEAVETEEFEYFPLPSKAYVFTAFDDTVGMEMNPESKYIEFNPQDEILPYGMLSDTGERKYVFPIYHCSVQYGYMIFRPGNFDSTLYTILCTSFSSVIAASYSYTQALLERQKLTRNNSELLHISHTDEMTGLLNRRGYMQHGQQTIMMSLDMNQTGFVVFGDMDGLKKINDTWGHDAGDRAIRAEAKILQKTFRATDVIGRIGGDEFGIITVGMDTKSFSRIKTRLKKFCKEYNESSGEPFQISISLGAVQYSHENDNLMVLLNEADSLLYVEKRRKKAKAVAK